MNTIDASGWTDMLTTQKKADSGGCTPHMGRKISILSLQAREDGKQRVYNLLTQFVRPLWLTKKLYQTSAWAKKPPANEGGNSKTKTEMPGRTDIPGVERTAVAAH